MLARSARCAFLAGYKSGRQFCRSRTCSRQNMRGTGFEPADLYRTAPSTLRRWPSLATHARGVSLQPSVIRGAIKGLSFVDRPVGCPRFRASALAVFLRESRPNAPAGGGATSRGFESPSGIRKRDPAVCPRRGARESTTPSCSRYCARCGWGLHAGSSGGTHPLEVGLWRRARRQRQFNCRCPPLYPVQDTGDGEAHGVTLASTDPTSGPVDGGPSMPRNVPWPRWHASPHGLSVARHGQSESRCGRL